MQKNKRTQNRIKKLMIKGMEVLLYYRKTYFIYAAESYE